MIALRMIFVLLLTNLAGGRERRKVARHRLGWMDRVRALATERRQYRMPAVVDRVIDYGNECWSYRINGRDQFVYGRVLRTSNT